MRRDDHIPRRCAFPALCPAETKEFAAGARDSAFSIVVPILEQLFGWRSTGIRDLFDAYGLTLHDWEKARTDRLTVLGARDTVEGGA